MKLLLDENLPEQLLFTFSYTRSVFCYTEGVESIKNGVLLKLMMEDKFEVFVTGDKNLQYQQSLKNYDLIVIVLHPKRMVYERIVPLIEKVLHLLSLEHTAPGIYIID